MTGYVWGATAAGRSAKGASLDAEAGLRFAAATALAQRGEEISEMAFARRSTGALPILDSRAARKPAPKKIGQMNAAV